MFESPSLRKSTSSIEFWGPYLGPTLTFDAGAIDLRREIKISLPWHREKSNTALPSPRGKPACGIGPRTQLPISPFPLVRASPCLHLPKSPRLRPPSFSSDRRLLLRSHTSSTTFAHRNTPRAVDGFEELLNTRNSSSSNRSIARVSLQEYTPQHVNATSQRCTERFSMFSERILGGALQGLNVQPGSLSVATPPDSQRVRQRERALSASKQAAKRRPEDTTHDTAQQQEQDSTYSLRGKGNEAAVSSLEQAATTSADGVDGIENQGRANAPPTAPHVAAHDETLTTAAILLSSEPSVAAKNHTVISANSSCASLDDDGMSGKTAQRENASCSGSYGRGEPPEGLQNITSHSRSTFSIESYGRGQPHVDRKSQNTAQQFGRASSSGSYDRMQRPVDEKSRNITQHFVNGTDSGSHGCGTSPVDQRLHSGAPQCESASCSECFERKPRTIDQWACQDGRGAVGRAVVDELVTSDTVPSKFAPKRTKVDFDYDILGVDVLDGTRYAASWAGSSETPCVSRRPGSSTERKLRRVSKWQVDPGLWTEHVQCMRAKNIKGVIPILDVYEDDAYFYVIFDHAHESLIETLSIILKRQTIPDDVLHALHEQVEEACEELCNAHLATGEFDVLVHEEVCEAGSIYTVKLDPMRAFGIVEAPENGFAEARERIAMLLTGPVEDIILAGERERLARVRTDIFVHKGRENRIWQLPGKLPSAPCNARLREEWLTLLWKVYSDLAETTEPVAQDLLSALIDVPGPWPFAWLKDGAYTDAPVSFGALRNALHQSNRCE